MIEITTFSEHLKSLTESDWNKLFDLQTEIEQTEKFGTLHGMDKTADGYIQLPFWDFEPITDNFIQVVRCLGLRHDFDYIHWKEGKKILNNNNKQDFNKLDIITLCKLLDTIISAEKFNDGLIVSYFKNGTIQKIIKALQNNVSPKI